MKATNKREARERASLAINKWAAGFASIAWIPFPHYAMTAGDVTMVVQVGSIYAVDLDRSAAVTLFTTVAAPLIGSKIRPLDPRFRSNRGMVGKVGCGSRRYYSSRQSLIHYFEDCSSLPD